MVRLINLLPEVYRIDGGRQDFSGHLTSGLFIIYCVTARHTVSLYCTVKSACFFHGVTEIANNPWEISKRYQFARLVRLDIISGIHRGHAAEF